MSWEEFENLINNLVKQIQGYSLVKDCPLRDYKNRNVC